MTEAGTAPPADALLLVSAQQHRWEYHTDPAERRGVQLKRNAGPNPGLAHDTRAEAFFRHFPQTTQELS
jgi:4-oxalomesaconate hydratase